MPPLPEGRCRVCALPARTAVCSNRCDGLKTLRNRVDASAELFDAQALARLRRQAKGDTWCPGTLSFEVLGELGIRVRDARDALSVCRARWLAMRGAGRVRFYQRGRLVPPGKDEIRGPWRVEIS